MKGKMSRAKDSNLIQIIRFTRLDRATVALWLDPVEGRCYRGETCGSLEHPAGAASELTLGRSASWVAERWCESYSEAQPRIQGEFGALESWLCAIGNALEGVMA